MNKIQSVSIKSVISLTTGVITSMVVPSLAPMLVMVPNAVFKILSYSGMISIFFSIIISVNGFWKATEPRYILVYLFGCFALLLSALRDFNPGMVALEMAGVIMLALNLVWKE